MNTTTRGDKTVRSALNGLLCLDIEAAGIGLGSFPIELAVADPCSGQVRCWLIQPTDEWLARGCWSPEAEAIHGIGLAQLLAEGLPVDQVAAKLVGYCRGHRLLSDAPLLDGGWLSELMLAARVLDLPAPVADFEQTLRHMALAGRLTDAAVAAARDAAAESFPRTHRAGPDAVHLAAVLRQLVSPAGTR